MIHGEARRFAEGEERAFDKLALADHLDDCVANQLLIEAEYDVAESFVAVHDYCSPNRDSGRSLEISPKREPNRLYSWQEFVDDEELRTWIPWWAPECVIGHLYVPFTCKGLRVPEECAAEITRMCGGYVTEDAWRKEKCSWEIEQFLKSDSIRPGRVYHRLPVWLVVLPSTSGLVPCLYATVHHWDEFQINESLKDETYFEHSAATTPSFVEAIGNQLENDAVYFVDDDNDSEPTYICARENTIDVIGWRVDHRVENFQSDLSAAWSVYDLPEWLQDHPVQRLLKLTADSEEANTFALTRRVFPKDFSYRHVTWGIDGSETIFRPRFPNPEATHTAPVRQNTIAAYLLQSFVDGKELALFEVLKSDAVAKASAAKELIDAEAAKYQAAFDERYGK